VALTIWHNPRCSKSRETLALLTARGLDPVVRNYLQDPPTAAEIGAALKALGLPARDLLRKGEPAFRELGLSPDMAEADLIAAMAANPGLIERPVVFKDGRGAVGRPPEAVLAIL